MIRPPIRRQPSSLPELLASASQFYEDILKKDPNNPDLQAGLAAAFYRVGFVRFDTGDRDQSEQAMERAAQFYTSALAIQPANTELKHGLANCWFMIAVTNFLNRNATTSNENAKKAAQIWEGLIQGGEKDIRFQKELARAYNLIGINYSNLQRPEESFLAYRRSLSIRLALISDHPDDVQVRSVEGSQATILELRVNAEDLGKVIGRQGRTAKAVRTLLGAAGMKIHKRFTLEILED